MMNRLMTTTLMLGLVAGMLGVSACTQKVETGQQGEDGAYMAQESGSMQNVSDLKEGQPLNYYQQEFNRGGYVIRDVDTTATHTVYDLQRGDQRYLVTLFYNEPQDNVNRVSVQQLRVMGSSAVSTQREQGNNPDQTMPSEGEPNQMEANQQKNNTVAYDSDPVIKNIQSLQPGKKPFEYLSLISKWGTVTEYSFEGDNAEIELRANNRHYDIELDVNEKTQMVSKIEADREIWEL